MVYKFTYPARYSKFSQVLNDSTYKYRNSVVSYGGNIQSEWAWLMAETWGGVNHLEIKCASKKDQGSGTISSLYATNSKTSTWLTPDSPLKSRYIWSNDKSYTNKTY